MWELCIYDTSACWLFSTKELAEDAIEFFELDEDEYSIRERHCINDDNEIIKCFRNCDFKPEKYNVK